MILITAFKNHDVSERVFSSIIRAKVKVLKDPRQSFFCRIEHSILRARLKHFE